MGEFVTMLSKSRVLSNMLIVTENINGNAFTPAIKRARQLSSRRKRFSRASSFGLAVALCIISPSSAMATPPPAQQLCISVTVDPAVWLHYHENTNAQLTASLGSEIQKRMQEVGRNPYIKNSGRSKIVPISEGYSCNNISSAIVFISYKSTRIADVIEVTTSISLSELQYISKIEELDIRKDKKLGPGYAQNSIYRSIKEISIVLFQLIN